MHSLPTAVAPHPSVPYVVGKAPVRPAIRRSVVRAAGRFGRPCAVLFVQGYGEALLLRFLCVYLNDDPPTPAHTPFLLLGHVFLLRGGERGACVAGQSARSGDHSDVHALQGGGLSAVSLCLDRTALRRRILLLPQSGRPAARTAGRKLRRGLCPVLCIVETDGPVPV